MKARMQSAWRRLRSNNNEPFPDKKIAGKFRGHSAVCMDWDTSLIWLWSGNVAEFGGFLTLPLSREQALKLILLHAL